jgi:hypothetical protein
VCVCVCVCVRLCVNREQVGLQVVVANTVLIAVWLSSAAPQPHSSTTPQPGILKAREQSLLVP